MKPSPESRSRSNPATTAVARCGCRCDAPARRPSRTREFGRESMGDLCSQVRGVFIDRLDAAYLGGRLGELLGRDHAHPEVRSRALALLQEVQLALFPEDFAEDEEAAAAIAGLVPSHGPALNRVGPRRMAAFLAMVGG